MTTFITRCPHCNHHFKIDAQSIDPTNTPVRCGHCEHTFNANAALFSFVEEEGVRLEDLERRSAIEKKALQQMASLADQMADFDAVSEPAQQNRLNQSSASLSPMQSRAAGAPVKQEIITAPLAKTDSFSEDDFDDDAQEDLPKKANRSRAWIWLVLLVFVLIVAVKVLAAYRSEVLARAPQMQPVYEQLCQHLTCGNHAKDEAELAQKLAPVKPSVFKTNELRLERLANNRWGITLYLINTSPNDQPYPQLMIKLLDANRAVLLRHTLQAKQYLFNPEEKMKGSDTEKVAFSFDLTQGEPTDFTVQIIE